VTPELLKDWLSMTVPHPTQGIHISLGNLKEHPYFEPLVRRIEDAYGVVTRLRVLVMEPGCEALKPHTHKADSIVYYPYDHRIGVSSGQVSRAGVKAGSHVRIASKLEHYVGANITEEPRISVVMEINDPYFTIKDGECATCRKWRDRMPAAIRDYMDKRWPL